MQIKPSDPRSFVDDECLEAYEHEVLIVSRRKIIEFLWLNSYASVSHIHEGAKVSINAIAAVYLELFPIEVLHKEGPIISLTDEGRRWVLANRKNLFMKPIKVEYSKRAPPEYLAILSENGKLPKTYRF